MSGILRNRQDTFKPIGVKTRYVFVQLASFEKKESECESLDEVANIATLTPQERYDYEADLKMVRDTSTRSAEHMRTGMRKAEKKAWRKAERKVEWKK